MSRRIAAVALAAGLAGTTALTAAPAQAAILHVCPPGYYGVEVYDTRGRVIAWLCVRPLAGDAA